MSRVELKDIRRIRKLSHLPGTWPVLELFITVSSGDTAYLQYRSIVQCERMDYGRAKLWLVREEGRAKSFRSCTM